MVKMVLELRHDCAGVSWMGMNIFAAATMAGCDDAAHAGNSAGRPNDGSLEPGINILIWIPAPPARCGIWTRMFVFLLVSNYGVYVLSQVGPLTLCVAPLGPGGDNALTPENLPGMNAPM